MIRAGNIKLTQPRNGMQSVPNTCFVVVLAVLSRARECLSESFFDKPLPPLNRPRFPTTRDADYLIYSRLFQSSDDYKPLASVFGWTGDVETGDEGEAYDFLMKNIGKVTDDPGYF